MEEHKRRAHYSGKYPKKYNEKYKELNPEKYGDISGHVIEKGNTPAGTHISIMVNEVLNVLKIRPGENGLDATLGYGGHSEKMLECLEGRGHLTSLDIDPIESKKTEARLRAKGFTGEIFSVELTNFKNIDKMAEKYGKFDFILADLGVSSMQIDNPERGFSYKSDGPLDLRMNPLEGIPAWQRLKKLSPEEIEDMLVENSDEPYAGRITSEIINARKSGNYLERTTDLKSVIEKALSFLPQKDRKEEVKKSCARVFQALRIDVNQEFEVLYELLEKLPGVLNEGGRAAILTFHSGEDRLVKKSFKYHKEQGDYREIASEVTRPSLEECVLNPRSKSTKLRWAVK